MLKKLLLLLIFVNLSFSSEIQRKILVLVPEGISIDTSNVHLKLESVLNYYGYFAEHITESPENYPEDISEYVGLIYWNENAQTENPLELAYFISQFKDKKNILLGKLPLEDYNHINYANEINSILKENFGFYFGNFWSNNAQTIQRNYDSNFFNFEMRISFLNQKYFNQVISDESGHKTIFSESLDGHHSNSSFFAPWGFFSLLSKVYYQHPDHKNPGKNRWIIDPFKLVERVYKTNYPIPDTTTKNGQRIAYIHIDGDGILSTSFKREYNIETGYKFLKKQKLKTGVSFVVSELDEAGPILSRSNRFSQQLFNGKTLNAYAKKTLELPFVEPASHTYSHPFNWRKGLVAYSVNPEAQEAYHDKIKAFQEPDHQINLELEIEDSIEYIQNLIPSKKVQTVYWTGDCYPSIRDLQYIEENDLFAFNGGDSRFDLEYNSYSYVTPLSLYSHQGTQIYSSNSNENTYTNLWTANFWRFRNVIKTFENTGHPKRIKPANAYYHYYSFSKQSSLKALEKIYAYYKKHPFNFIYPSEFIKIAKNFHDIKIKTIEGGFEISNIKELREFRFEGRVNLKSEQIQNIFYDKMLNVTYVRIKNDISKAILKLEG